MNACSVAEMVRLRPWSVEVSRLILSMQRFKTSLPSTGSVLRWEEKQNSGIARALALSLERHWQLSTWSVTATAAKLVWDCCWMAYHGKGCLQTTSQIPFRCFIKILDCLFSVPLKTERLWAQTLSADFRGWTGLLSLPLHSVQTCSTWNSPPLPKYTHNIHTHTHARTHTPTPLFTPLSQYVTLLQI